MRFFTVVSADFNPRRGFAQCFFQLFCADQRAVAGPGAAVLRIPGTGGQIDLQKPADQRLQGG